MKSFDLLRYLKKWWFLIMLITAVGCLGVYEFISSRQSYTATAVIQYAGPNASEGLNADGTRIDPSEITSASVINKTIQDLGLTASTESIRPRISVQEVIPEDEETKKETALSNGDEYEYYPTTYAVSFTVDSKDATDYARKMALDMRMIDPHYEDHPDNKASHCAKMIAEYYQKYDAQKGTQFVFSDLGTYQPGDGWNVYSEIKRKLTEDYGIPPSEVRFIQECKTDKARKAVIDAMNAGTVRVLFGSTSMLGTGVNAQKRCVAIHHLDTPWRPSDLQQRDGRGVRAGNEIAKHFAGNNVDVIIYAVEKSLDSYKFNLLHCKQTFISQLKSGAMGARTIDEGAMDEKSGMNFSEYMALLSGNTDLLDKAKLEKRIASLEGERKSFNKGKRDSEFKLESKTGELRNNTAFIDAMTEDWNRFLSVVQTDKEGNRLNIIKVDGVDSADEKVIGKRLQEIAKNATTGGLYTQVGELYGFPIKVVSERILKEGLEFTDNRFVVEGNYKYTYNNGHLAMADPLAAARNFLNAMERIPSIIDQYKAKNEVLEMEIPQLQEIAGKVWKKEDELKQLKSELAALDRKIQLELAPPTPEVAEKENEGQQLKPEAEDVRNRQAQYPENAPPQIRSPADSIVANHVIIGRPGLYAKEETRSKGLKI